MAKTAYFISTDCVADSDATPLQKLIFAILSTDSKVIAGERKRYSRGANPGYLLARLGVKDLRTIKTALQALESREIIKQVKGGIEVFPWPVPEGEDCEDTTSLDAPVAQPPRKTMAEVLAEIEREQQEALQAGRAA